MTTAQLPDTWFSRDLPVLVQAVRHFDATIQPLAAATVADRLGWPVERVAAAVRALARDGYVQDLPDFDSEGGREMAGVSAQAYREVGAWPSAETMADRLLAALQTAVDNAPDDEARSRGRRVLDAVRAAGPGFLRDVGSGVITNLITSA